MFRAIFHLLQNDNMRNLYTISQAPLKKKNQKEIICRKGFFAVKLTFYRLKDYKLYCDLR